VRVTNITIMTLGRSTFRPENGQSYNALDPLPLLVDIMLLSLSMMLCMSLVGSPGTKAVWTICMPFSCPVSDLACCVATLFTCEIQRSDGSSFTTWGRVLIEGRIMPCLLMVHVSLCLEDIYQVHARMKFPSFTSLTQVCMFVLSITWTAFQLENTEHIKYPDPEGENTRLEFEQQLSALLAVKLSGTTELRS
jgi:hypothetical protein